jgi:DNA-binding LacI/PurR family transcriptional regulator
MKVTPEHLAMIRDAIAETGYDTEELRARYRARDIPRGDLVQDIDKRFRWDLLNGANRVSVDLKANTMLISTLYDAGYHDGHLDTALRAIVAPL